MLGHEEEQREEEGRPPVGTDGGASPESEARDPADGTGETLAAGAAGSDAEPWSEAGPGAAPAGAATAPRGQVAEGAIRDRAEVWIRENAGRAYAAVNMEIHEAADAAEAAAKRLSHGHFEAWPPDRLQRDAAELVADDGQIGHLVAVLEKRRVLVIVGEPELGKANTALLLADCIRARGGISGMLLCRRLDGTVRVDVNELAGGEPAYHNQLLIFKDAFAWGNADLQRFAAELTTATWRSYADRLEEVGSFLVLTSDSSKVGGSESLHNLGILQQIPRPAAALLAKSFQRQVGHLVRVLVERGVPADKVKAVLNVVESEGKGLAEKLGTFPRVGRFVRDHLFSVAQGRLTAPQALERMDDLTRWLLSDLAEDFDVFCSVLALALCSATLHPQGVPWLRFERVRREVELALRRELRRTSRDREVGDLCRHEVIVEKTRAEIVRSPFPEADVIRFADESYPARLWQILIGPGRNLLALLKPPLESMLLEREPFVREVAAQALGRIGQLDPAFVTTPLLESWVHDERFDQTDLLGQLLQGVVSSEDRDYRDGCLAHLYRLATGSNLRAARTAVVSLREVGSVDLQAALAGLKYVLRARVKIAWDYLKQAQRMLRGYEGTVRREELHDATWAVLSSGFATKEGAYILGTVQYTIAGLMFARLDLTPVLEGLSDWIAEDDEDLAPVVVYLFLHERGLANLMQRYKVTVGRNWQEPPVRCDRIVYALGTGDDAIRQVQAFVRRMFGRLHRFPSLFRGILREELFNRLKSWAREACVVPELRCPVVQLLAGLYNSPAAEMGDAIDRWLRSDRDFSNRQSELYKFAVDVLTWTSPSSGEASLLSVAARCD